MTRTRKPAPAPDPIEQWPKPDRNWSSMHAAAEALWRRSGDAYEPDGAATYFLDVLDIVRRRLGLPMNATPQDVMAVPNWTRVLDPIEDRDHVAATLRYLKHAFPGTVTAD
jgi:hypothetical protein